MEDYTNPDNYITMFRGDDQRVELQFTDDADQTHPDISGWKVWFTVKKRDTDIDSDAIMPIITVVSHDDPTNGKTSFIIPHAQTDLLVKGNYVYDIQYKDSEGYIGTVIKGVFRILQDVTIENS